MQANEVDPIEFLRRLEQEGVRYLLVGRQAVVQYGGPVQSFDYDIFVNPSRADFAALTRVAESLDLEGMPEATEPLPPMFSLYADNLKIDVFRARAYSLRDGTSIVFDDLYQRHETRSDATLTVHLPALEDLIATKKLRDTPKDREDLAYLEAIRSR